MTGWAYFFAAMGIAAGVLVFLRIVADHLAVLDAAISHRAAALAKAAAKAAKTAENGQAKPSSSRIQARIPTRA